MESKACFKLNLIEGVAWVFLVVVLGYGLISLACSLVGRTNLDVEDQFFICNADICIIIMPK